MTQPTTNETPRFRYTLRPTASGRVMIDKLKEAADFDPPLWEQVRSFGPFRGRDTACDFMLRHGGRP